MSALARTDTSLIGHWWWTVDRWTMATLVAIAGLGALLAMAASPAVAERIGFDTFYFARRQFVFLAAALVVMVATSLLAPRGVRRLALVCLTASVALMVAALLVGPEIKGATRWVSLGGFSVQPSEFVKPAFVVVAAWILAAARADDRFPGQAIAAGLLALVVMLLALQPDVGMAMVVAAVWGVQLFLAGLPLVLVGAMALIFLAAGAGAYLAFPHVRVRIDRFLDPAGGDNYQVDRALEAFRNGGLFGRGPGEGRVKEVLPDAHADFVFAVAGEEFGVVVCLLIVVLFAFVVLRGLSRVLRETDLFVLLAVGGLLVQVALQTLVNMASNLALIPPKGVTLPFISYGGSSALALGLGLGMVLALTRQRAGARRPA